MKVLQRFLLLLSERNHLLLLSERNHLLKIENICGIINCL